MLIILNFGVAIFAFLMSQFLEILLARSKLDCSTNQSKDLTKWISLLRKYN
jgi:hypothetical protein